jgi:Carbohydrate-binding module family 5/12
MPEIVGRLRSPRLSAAPSSPAVGEVYYDTALNKLFWWNGTSWIDSTGGVDLVYNGTFPANTPYTDGDIVIYNGVAYMCVRPTSATPTPWIGNPIPAIAIRGGFSSTGAVTKGAGFTVTRTAVGFYTINFATAFATPPVFVATNSTGVVNANIESYSITTTQVLLKTLAGSTGTDMDVDFIAMAV